MSPTCIKKGRSREDIISNLPTEDIISNLPTDVIYCILGKMPIRDAIRTSVLSKKWRFCYSYIPELVFDEEFCKELKTITRKKSREYKFDEYREYMYQFDKIVTKSLMLHLGGIERFKVCIPDFKSSRSVLDVLDVNKWILYLSSKNIKKLTLKHKNEHIEHLRLPPYFFSCLDLTYLKLQNFALCPTPEFKGFRNLKQLILIEVDLPNICFESLLFDCPVLERLELHWCSGIHNFNINGSNLKTLCIKDDDEFESICLADAPNLTEVSISLRGEFLNGIPISDLILFMERLPKVGILHLNGKFLQFLAEAGEIPMRLPFDLNCVKRLYLSHLNLNESDEVMCTLCLIRSSPYLQYMQIQVDNSDDDDDDEEFHVLDEVKRFSDVTFNHLREVKLVNITGTRPQIMLIELLLAKSPALERFLIEPRPGNEQPLDVIVEILAELTKFQRASPKAKVVYDYNKNRWYNQLIRS